MSRNRYPSSTEPVAAVSRHDVCVLDADPDLGRGLSRTEFAAARLNSLAPLRTLYVGAWRPDHEQFDEDGLGLLLLHGVLRRRVILHDRTTCELLGAGDLLRPWQEEDHYAGVPTQTEWAVRATTPVAVLDADVTRRLATWPSILSEIAGRTMRRSRTLAVQLTIAQVSSLETRVLLVLWHLADRWGRVVHDGVILGLRPEQETIGNLIGVSRPRVNTTLRSLMESGKLQRHPEGWLLRGTAPKPATALPPGSR